MNAATITQKKGRKPAYETEFDAAVKLQYQLIFMRTGEEPELPSELEKRIGKEAAQEKIMAQNMELENIQIAMASQDLENEEQ